MELFAVKEKEVAPPQEVQVDDDEDESSKKRHLNVVFIGHVGKW